MNTFRSIRQALGCTQAELGAALGMTQGNVSLYENGQTVPPDVAKKLIGYARTKGHALTFNDVYRDLTPTTEPAAAGG